MVSVSFTASDVIKVLCVKTMFCCTCYRFTLCRDLHISVWGHKPQKASVLHSRTSIIHIIIIIIIIIYIWEIDKQAKCSQQRWWEMKRTYMRQSTMRGWGSDRGGMLVWLHTQRLTWPASSLSVGGFLAAPDRCGRGRCCGPPAPACWACSEASQPAAPSSFCVGGSLSSSNTS